MEASPRRRIAPTSLYARLNLIGADLVNPEKCKVGGKDGRWRSLQNLVDLIVLDVRVRKDQQLA
jgi:hypothetical protein